MFSRPPIHILREVVLPPPLRVNVCPSPLKNVLIVYCVASLNLNSLNFFYLFLYNNNAQKDCSCMNKADIYRKVFFIMDFKHNLIDFIYNFVDFIYNLVDFIYNLVDYIHCYIS